MKTLSRFLFIALALVSVDAYSASPVATTLGSNLTAFNGGSGATNNAMWNAYMNPRSNSATNAPVADFGNCNSVILRCAQPKCAGGGCTSMDVARTIVSGCVESNPACKQYGNELIDFLSAQMVADSQASANEQAAVATAAATAASAQQSNQQMAQMQQQMAQLQQQIQQQSANTAAQIETALAQQQQATADAIAAATAQQTVATTAPTTTTTATTAPATASTTTDGGGDLTVAQQVAAESGISADLLAREQISGQILSKIEDAEVDLRTAAAAMQTVFDYAGCDSTGSNCTGPKRVETFKRKALEFFEPYNDVLDEIYDALILAQSVGVDITDIYMMLNGTCNAWGQYLCGPGQVMHYNSTNCPNGRSVPVATADGTVRGGATCRVGQVVPMSDGGCQLIKVLASDEEVQRNWLYPETGEGGVQVRVGCASEILDNSTLFRNRKKQADIDIEVLERMIEQDAPAVFGNSRSGKTKSADPDGVKYCAVGTDSLQDLQTYASLKRLPETVCVPDSKLESILQNEGRLGSGDSGADGLSVISKCGALQGYQYLECLCRNSPTHNAQWVPSTDKDAVAIGAGECRCVGGGQYNTFDYDRAMCVDENGNAEADKKYHNDDMPTTASELCNDNGGVWDYLTSSCDCSGVSDPLKKQVCEIQSGSWLKSQNTINSSDPFGVLQEFQNTVQSANISMCTTFGGTWDYSTSRCDCSALTGTDRWKSCMDFNMSLMSV